MPGCARSSHSERHAAEHSGLQRRREPAVTFLSNGELQVYGNKCLDVPSHARTAAPGWQIYDCNGGSNQLWNLNSTARRRSRVWSLPRRGWRRHRERPRSGHLDLQRRQQSEVDPIITRNSTAEAGHGPGVANAVPGPSLLFLEE